MKKTLSVNKTNTPVVWDRTSSIGLVGNRTIEEIPVQVHSTWTSQDPRDGKVSETGNRMDFHNQSGVPQVLTQHFDVGLYYKFHKSSTSMYPWLSVLSTTDIWYPYRYEHV